MDNLDISGIAIGATIVALLNLIIVVLVKTETILKYVERIKGILKLDYRSRAKRIDDEIRLLKKYETVARERVRRSFVAFEQWDCKWTWNWSDEFEPINVTGHCVGNKSKYSELRFECSYPVQAYYLVQTPEEKKRGFIRLAVLCGQEGVLPHKQLRAKFAVTQSTSETLTAREAFESLLRKAIDSERDIRVAREIRFLRRQFWR
jgi:hypothetical protein